jgi:hypothetical protein
MSPLSQRHIISNLKRIGVVAIKKKLEMFKCADTTHHVWPRPGGETSTPRIMKFTISVEVFLLYITMHLVFLKYM